MSVRVNVLFTSVGRRVELVRAFKRAYAELDLDGRLSATDLDPLAPALQEVDEVHLVPPLTDPSYVDALVEICQRDKVDLVFPLIDPDAPVLAANRATLEATGARLVVLPDTSVDIVSDKWATLGFLSGEGVPTPETWLQEQRTARDLTFPVFIKPRRGSAGKQTFLVNNEKEHAFFVDYVEDPVLQEYVGGPEVTSDVVCDLRGEVLGIVSRERIEVRAGEVAKGKTIYDPEIERHCVTIARALEAVGPITVQCLRKGGEPLFTEINPRFAGGVPLAIAAGADFPKWLLASVSGLPCEIPPLGSYHRGLYATRYDDSFWLTEEGLEGVESRRLRSG